MDQRRADVRPRGDRPDRGQLDRRQPEGPGAGRRSTAPRTPAPLHREGRGVEPWSPASALTERRTVVIRGQVADRGRPVGTRRPGRSPQERALMNPDRIAMWAVLLGLLLIVVAATTAHA